MQRPHGVTAIAAIFFLASAYLIAIGLTLLLKPGTVSLMLGSPLLGGLELAGPYMFLLMSGVSIAIGLGLLLLNNWARRLAIIAALLGVFLLVPTVSAAATGYRPAALFFSGLGIVIRVIVAWYLYQAPVIEAFRPAPGTRSLTN
jgi:hypothetical protein